MNTLIKTPAAGMNLTTMPGTNTDETLENIVDAIIDSFNEQLCLGDHFQQHIDRLILELAPLSLAGRIKLSQSIRDYLESSHKMMGEYMNKALDLCSAAKTGRNNVLITVRPGHSINEQWARDWMEQLSELKNEPEGALLSPDTSMEDFCFYDSEWALKANVTGC